MAFEIRNIGEALDLDTGQVVALTPDYIKQLDDETLAQFIYESKRFAKLPKAGEEELKSRLESGKRFSMVDFGKPAVTKVLTDNNARKRELVIKHGWDCVSLKSLTELKKIYGEKFEDEISDLIVIGEKNPALKWKV